MTNDQFTLLQDKIALWRRSSTDGPMDLRDYNRRAEEALTAALVERSQLLAELKWCFMGSGSMSRMAAVIAEAEDR